MFLIKTLRELEPSAKVLEAENGLEAVELFKVEKPDAVFLDLTMPVMDGYEALKEIIKWILKRKLSLFLQIFRPRHNLLFSHRVPK